MYFYRIGQVIDKTSICTINKDDNIHEKEAIYPNEHKQIKNAQCNGLIDFQIMNIKLLSFLNFTQMLQNYHTKLNFDRTILTYLN